MIKLVRTDVNDTKKIHSMQIESFKELLIKYRDFVTSPANESIDLVRRRLEQDFTYYYLICDDEVEIGAIRVVDKKDGSRKRISPIFILGEYRNKGFAQQAILEAEGIHGSSNWLLETILEEKGNCYLYEKLGYVQNGNFKKVNDQLTLVEYIKK